MSDPFWQNHRTSAGSLAAAEYLHNLSDPGSVLPDSLSTVAGGLPAHLHSGSQGDCSRGSGDAQCIREALVASCGAVTERGGLPATSSTHNLLLYRCHKCRQNSVPLDCQHAGGLPAHRFVLDGELALLRSERSMRHRKPSLYLEGCALLQARAEQTHNRHTYALRRLRQRLRIDSVA